MSLGLVHGTQVLIFERGAVDLLEKLVATVNAGVVFMPQGFGIEVRNQHREAVEAAGLHGVVGTGASGVAAVPEDLADHLERTVLRAAADSLGGAPGQHVVSRGE